MFCSILCTRIKYCKRSTQSKLNCFTRILTCVYFIGSCFFVCCSLSIILHLWLTVTGPVNSLLVIFLLLSISTRKPSYLWQTRATWKHAKNYSNSTCLQRCCWQYWPIFIRLAVVADEICEIQGNSLKIQTYGVQGHPNSSILVPVESPYVTSY